mgnify:CR=1 FL=1
MFSQGELHFIYFALSLQNYLTLCLQIFTMILQVIRENDEAFRHLGIELGDLGSHLAQKGACSLATAGTTVSPPIVSICLCTM